MNVKVVRKLALLAILGGVGPATAGATELIGSLSNAYSTSTAADKAAEAKRLAAQAAELAQRAATLAAESQAEQIPAVAPKKIQTVSQSTEWNARGAAEVLISDKDTQPAMPAIPSIGWRSHRENAAPVIRFTGSAMATSLPTAAKPSVAAAQKRQAKRIADAKTAEARSTPASTEVKRSGAAPAAKTIADQKAAHVTTNVEPTKTAAVQKPASGSVEPQALKDGNVQLATTHKDAKVKPADSEEPIPVPDSPYDSDSLGNREPCECVDEACCPQRRPLFWSSGIEATFLRPDLNDGSAAFGVAEFVDERVDEFSTETDDVDDFYMAPRIWIGVQGCLWGANLRYWHLRANEGSYDPTLGSDGEWDGPNCGVPDFGYTSCNDLEAYTVDLEITRRFCLHDCWMQFSAGVRHAEIEQDASLFGTALADDSQVFGFAGAHRQMRGTGLVFGWYGRRPIFPCSCVHWFYNARLSTMWGPTETAAETGVMLALTTADPLAVATAGSVNSASTAVDDNLFIGEIQLGLEWDYALRCLPANAFCRAAFEYQRWSGGQGFSAANSFAGVEIDDEPTTLADALALADAPELDLFGVSISTGLTW